MAVLREQPGLGPLSGRLANVAFAQTKHGTVMRSRPDVRSKPSPKKAEAGRRLGLVNAAWRSLSEADADAWRSYALATGGDAYRSFIALSSKFLQVHGGFEVPSRPPEGVFFGDALAVSLGSSGGALAFLPAGANRPGMLTELMGQRVTGPHNVPRPRSYASLGFVAFADATPVTVAVDRPGTWVCAVRFVEAATGRMTDLVEIGRARVAA